jgi:(p)ppGpp synthase/HD superfamily hydrolase
MRWLDIIDTPLEEYVSPEKHMFKRTTLYKQLETNNMKNSLLALDLAGRHHTGIRKDGVTHELDHQISIARFLLKLTSNMMYPDETIAVALLHDLSEDYNIPYSDIKNYFGGRISRAVVLLTKEYMGQKRPPETYFNHITQDPIASIVKGGDRIHNQATMQSFKPSKKAEYTGETNDWIIPMLLQAKENFPQQSSIYDKMLKILGWQIKIHSAPQNQEVKAA